MYPFLQILLEKETDLRHPGHYTAARVSKKSTAALKKWCEKNKITVDGEFFDNLHVTLCYSTKLFPIDTDAVIDDASDWKVTPTEFAEFGKHQDKKYLVVKLKCPRATKRWQHYIDQGASYDFDDYLPHVTIAQNFGGDIKSLDVSTLPKIELSEEYYEKLS